MPIDPQKQSDEIFGRWIRNLPGAAQTIARELSAEMHQKLSLPGEGLWPQITSNHGEHPYARDRSVVTWSQSDQTSGDVIRIVTTNESAYSGYVDKGYTRYGGKGSAKPWKARGSRSYVGMVRGKLHVRAAGALFVRGLLRG